MKMRPFRRGWSRHRCKCKCKCVLHTYIYQRKVSVLSILTNTTGWKKTLGNRKIEEWVSSVETGSTLSRLIRIACGRTWWCCFITTRRTIQSSERDCFRKSIIGRTAFHWSVRVTTSRWTEKSFVIFIAKGLNYCKEKSSS